MDFVDRVMNLGFEYSFKSGISFGMDDIIVPESKNKHIQDTILEVQEFEEEYQNGLTTFGERYNKVVDAWSQCTDKVTSDLIRSMDNKANLWVVNIFFICACNNFYINFLMRYL